MPVTPKHETISVGMERTHVTRLLREAGAKATKLDGAGPTAAAHAGAAYEIRSGSLLIVDYSRASQAAPFRVTGLRLCSDADVPKSKRVWRTRTKVAL